MVGEGSVVKIELEGRDGEEIVERYEGYIIVGEGNVVKGVEEELIGKKEGDEFEIEVEPSKAYGERRGEFVKTIPLKRFEKEPRVGDVVREGEIVGRVISVGGGRAVVDFNHPLAGRRLRYKIKVIKEAEGDEEKAKAIVEMFGIRDAEVSVGKTKVSIKVKREIEVPRAIGKLLAEKLHKYVGVKKVEISDVFEF